MIKKLWISATATLLALAGCTHKNTKQTIKVKTSTKLIQANNKIAPATAKEPHTITVWIHGTRFESDFIREKLIKNIFYRAYIKDGLLHETAYKKRSNFRIISQNLSQQECTRFKPDNFYIFGWSGELRIKKRKVAAKKLYKSLLQLINRYKAKHGITPKIRFITHSHGGNVALHFAKINDKSAEKIKVSELVLLACPVQEKTAHLIASKTFEKIYSIYSGIDMIQVLDPQGLHKARKKAVKKIEKPFFSERAFVPQKNLTQVKIKINRRGIAHIEFILTRFAKILPHLLQEIDAWIKTENNDPDSHKKSRLLKIYTTGEKITFDRRVFNRP